MHACITEASVGIALPRSVMVSVDAEVELIVCFFALRGPFGF